MVLTCHFILNFKGFFLIIYINTLFLATKHFPLSPLLLFHVVSQVDSLHKSISVLADATLLCQSIQMKLVFINSCFFAILWYKQLFIEHKVSMFSFTSIKQALQACKNCLRAGFLLVITIKKKIIKTFHNKSTFAESALIFKK